MQSRWARASALLASSVAVLVLVPAAYSHAASGPPSRSLAAVSAVSPSVQVRVLADRLLPALRSRLAAVCAGASDGVCGSPDKPVFSRTWWSEPSSAQLRAGHFAADDPDHGLGVELPSGVLGLQVASHGRDSLPWLTVALDDGVYCWGWRADVVFLTSTARLMPLSCGSHAQLEASDGRSGGPGARWDASVLFNS